MSSDLTATLLASIPSPDRGVWHLGSVPIRAYALCIILGIVVAIWWAERRFVARGGRPGTVVDIAVIAVPFGLVGGRLYHVLTDWSKYFGEGANPVDALKIWQGGLGIWGAIALGGVGAWIGCRRRGVPLPFLADAAAPGIVVGQAIGRLGNWFNQELYGTATSLPWGLEIYERINPDTGARDSLTGVAIDSTPIALVHPTFLYELLWNLGVAALVVWADRRFRLGHGRAFALYVAGYTAGRFWIELLRVDPATEVFGTRINVITSVLVFAGAVTYMLLAPRGRETLPPQAAAEPEVAVAGAAGAGAEAGDRADSERTEAERAGVEHVDSERAGAEQSGAEQTDVEQAAAEQTDVERTDVERADAGDEGQVAAPASPAAEPEPQPQPEPQPEYAAQPETQAEPSSNGEPAQPAQAESGTEEGSPAGRSAKGS